MNEITPTITSKEEKNLHIFTQLVNRLRTSKSLVAMLLALLFVTSGLHAASANSNVIDPGDVVELYRNDGFYVGPMNYGAIGEVMTVSSCGTQQISSEGGNGRSFIVRYADHAHNSHCSESLIGTSQFPMSWNVRGLSNHLLGFGQPTIRALEVGEYGTTYKAEDGISIPTWDSDQFAIFMNPTTTVPNGAVVGYEITLPPESVGCYIDAPTAVDEGTSFTATVQCDGVSDMYGFELGSTLSGDASTAATGFDLGEFDSNAANDRLTPSNTLALFSQAYTGNDVANGSFTLGSFDVEADSFLTADGTIDITLDNFLASDASGSVLAALAAAPNASVTVNDIILTLLQGDVTVASDGVMANISNAALTVDGTGYSAAGAAGGSLDITVDQSGDVLSISVAADMDSHLACSETVSLVDGANDAATAIGTVTLLAGDVISVGGDEAINLQDAVAVGSAWGGAATGQEDINGDGVVNIFDLIHIGRNFLATSGTCN